MLRWLALTAAILACLTFAEGQVPAAGPGTNPDSSSSRHPDPPPLPPDVVAPEPPAPQSSANQSANPITRTLKKLAPNCIDGVFHACWSAPPQKPLPPQSDGRKGEASREVAEFYFAQRNYTAAESRFREALQFNPADAKAMFELAQTSEKLNRKDEALQEYRSCIEFDPRGAYAEKARRAIQRVGLHAASQGRSSRS